MMTKQELLPPDNTGRDHRGRFGPGNPGGGRPAGVENAITTELKDMVKQALENLGGVEYLTLMGAVRPELFLPLVGKCLPLKLATDPGAAVVYVVSERIITDIESK